MALCKNSSTFTASDNVSKEGWAHPDMLACPANWICSFLWKRFSGAWSQKVCPVYPFIHSSQFPGDTKKWKIRHLGNAYSCSSNMMAFNLILSFTESENSTLPCVRLWLGVQRKSYSGMRLACVRMCQHIYVMKYVSERTIHKHRALHANKANILMLLGMWQRAQKRCFRAHGSSALLWTWG